MESEYSKKLKDPRWQKKRLEIFERDKWGCQRCYDTESTLHVHHLRYLEGKDPWDYPDEYLITLCEECHEYEGSVQPGNESDLLAMIRPLFLADDIYSLTSGFHQMTLLHSHEVVASVYEWALSSPEIQRELIDKYLEQLLDKAKERKEG
jgi:hypothetical protein